MSPPSTLAIFIYSRLDSIRYPGKALVPIQGLPLLEVIWRRACLLPGAQPFLLTTQREVDDRLVEFSQSLGMPVIRGATDDLVQRTVQALDETGVSAFCRANGDSPLLDIDLVGQASRLLSPPLEMVTNLVPRSFPYGVAVECLDANFYRRMASSANEDEKEHVTQHIYRQWGRFSGKNIHCGSNLSAIRLTIDVPRDLIALEDMLRRGGHNILTVDYRDLAHDSKSERVPK